MLLDITKNINRKTPVYDGDPPYILSRWFSIANGNEFNVSKIEIGSHFGTHIDAPRHFFDNGADVSQLDINRICGECIVVSVHGAIDKAFLMSLCLAEESRVLFKTQGRYGITKEGAEFLASLGTKVVGTDALDIEDVGNEDFFCHKILLGAGIPIIEGLELWDIKDGAYRLICLPLKMEGLDGVPVRVALEDYG